MSVNLLAGRGAVVTGGSRGSYVAPLYAYLASDLAADTSGQIFVAAGGFVGRYDKPTPRMLGYRDHHRAEPWSVEDLQAMLGPTAVE